MTNNGPCDTTGVSTTDTLPGNMAFVSSTADQGSCSGTSTVTCSLGALSNSSTATVTIVVSPTEDVVGTVSNTASVTGDAGPQHLQQ